MAMHRTKLVHLGLGAAESLDLLFIHESKGTFCKASIKMLLFILFFCPAPLSGFSYGWQNALPYLPLVNGELQEGINVSQNAPVFWNQSQPPLE